MVLAYYRMGLAGNCPPDIVFDAALRAESLRAVCEDHEWCAPRLLYADLIEPSDKDTGDFVRVQMKLAGPAPKCEAPAYTGRGVLNCAEWNGRHPDRNNWCHPCKNRRDLRRRERELWRAYGGRWAAPHGATLDDYRRGFRWRHTCTWADWLRIERDVYWHPEQRETCGRCVPDKEAGPTMKDLPRVQEEIMPDGRVRRTQHIPPFDFRRAWPPQSHCPTCHGVGTVPRPFPATAQPLEEVRITDQDPRAFELGDTSGEINWSEHYSWPGLRFEFAGPLEARR